MPRVPVSLRIHFISSTNEDKEHEHIDYITIMICRDQGDFQQGFKAH